MKYIRLISTILVLTYLCEIPLQAAPANSLSGLFSRSGAGQLTAQSVSLKGLPEDLYSFDEAFNHADSAEIILIQDPHLNYSGQKNIAHILDWTGKNGYSTAYLEAGYGDVSLSELSADKRESEVHSVAEKNIRKGEISGAEYHNLTSPDPLRLWGVESRELYDESISLYKSVVDDRESVKTELTTIQNSLLSSADRYINPALLYLRDSLNRFERNDISFEFYLEHLLILALESGIEVGGFEDLLYLSEQISKQNRIDFKKANDEYQALMTELVNRHCTGDQLPDFCGELNRSGSLSANLENFRTIQRYSQLSGERPAVAEESQLGQYLSYLRSLESVDLPSALDQIKKLQRESENSLAVTPVEKSWIRTVHLIESVSKIVDLQADYSTAQSFMSDTDSTAGELLCGNFNRTSILAGGLGQCYLSNESESIIANAVSFYKKTLLRDRAFIANMIRKMRIEGEEKAVLIVGGFHATNVKNLLKSRRLSYVSIHPTVTEETDHSRYERILTHQSLPSETTSLPLNVSSIGIWAAKGRLNSPVISDLNALTVASRLSDETPQEKSPKPDSEDPVILPGTTLFTVLGITTSVVAAVIHRNPSILWVIPGWAAGGLFFDVLDYLISRFDKAKVQSGEDSADVETSATPDGAEGDIAISQGDNNDPMINPITKDADSQDQAVDVTEISETPETDSVVSITETGSLTESSVSESQSSAESEGEVQTSLEDSESDAAAEEDADIPQPALATKDFYELNEVESWWVDEISPILSVIASTLASGQPGSVQEAIDEKGALNQSILKLIPDFPGIKITLADKNSVFTEEAFKDLVWFIRRQLVVRQASVIPVVIQEDSVLRADILHVKETLQDIGPSDLDRRIYVVEEDSVLLEKVSDASDVRLHSQDNESDPRFKGFEDYSVLKKRKDSNRGLGIALAAVAVLHGVLLAPISIWLTVGISALSLSTILLSRFTWMEKSNRREFKTASTAFVVVVTSILLFAGLRTLMPTLGEPQAPVEITLELLDTTVSETESGDTEDAVTMELSGSVPMPESQTAEKLPETQEPTEQQETPVTPDLKTLEEAVAQLKTSEVAPSQLNEPTSAKPVRQEIFSEQAIQVSEADFSQLTNQGIGQAYSGISTGQGKRGRESKVFDVLGQQVAEIHDISVVLVTDTSASISNENLERNYFQAIQVAIYLMHQEATRDKTVEYASYGTDHDTYKLLGFEQSRNLDAVNKSLAELQSRWGRGSSDFKQTLDAMAKMFDGSKGKRKLIVFFTDASGLEKSQAMRYKEHYKKYGIDIAIVAVESSHATEIPNSINLEEEIDAYSILQVILSIISTESKTGNLPIKLKDITNINPSLIKGARLADGRRMFEENNTEPIGPVINITDTESSSQLQKFRIQAEKSRRLAQIRSVIWSVLIFTPLFLLIPIFADKSYSDDPETSGEASVAVVDPQATAETELDARLKDAEKLLKNAESLSLLEQKKLSGDLLFSAGILYEKFPDLQFRYEKRYQNAAGQHAQLTLKLALQNAEYAAWNQAIEIWEGNESQNFRIPQSDLQSIASEVLPEVIGEEARKINSQITAVESQISGGLVEIESLSGLLSDKKYLIHTELNSRVTGRSSAGSGVDAGILDRMEMPLLADPEARMVLLYHGYGSRYTETSENYFYYIDQESALKNAERVFVSYDHLEGYLNRVQKREPADVTPAVIRDKPKIHSEYDSAFRDGGEKLYQTLRTDRYGYIYTMNRDPEFKTITSVGGSDFINGNVISVYELINKSREELKALGISRVALNSSNRVTVYFEDKDIYSEDFKLFEPVAIVSGKDAQGESLPAVLYRVFLTDDFYSSIHVPRTADTVKENHRNRIARGVDLLKRSIAAGDLNRQIESLGGLYRIESRLKHLQYERGGLQVRLNLRQAENDALRSFAQSRGSEAQNAYSVATPDITPGVLTENQKVMWGRLLESLGREEDTSLLDKPIEEIGGLLTVRFADYLTRQIRRNFRNDRPNLELVLTLASQIPDHPEGRSVAEIVTQIQDNWTADTNAVAAGVSELNQFYLAPKGYFIRGYIPEANSRNINPELVSVLGIRGLQKVTVGSTSYYITHTDSGNLESMQNLLGYSQSGVSVANVNRDRTIATYQRIKEVLGQSEPASGFQKLLHRAVAIDFAGLSDEVIYEKIYRMVLANESQHAFEHAEEITAEGYEERSDYASIAEGSAPYLALIHFASHVRSGVYDEKEFEYALEAARSLDRLYRAYTKSEDKGTASVSPVETGLKDGGITEVDNALNQVVGALMNPQQGGREKLSSIALDLLRSDPAFEKSELASPYQTERSVSFPLEQEAAGIIHRLWELKKNEVNSVEDILKLLQDRAYWRDGFRSSSWNQALADEALDTVLQPAVRSALLQAQKNKDPLTVKDITDQISEVLLKAQTHAQPESSLPDISAKPVGVTSGSRLSAGVDLPDQLLFLGQVQKYDYASDLLLQLSVDRQILPWILSLDLELDRVYLPIASAGPHGVIRGLRAIQLRSEDRDQLRLETVAGYEIAFVPDQKSAAVEAAGRRSSAESEYRQLKNGFSTGFITAQRDINRLGDLQITSPVVIRVDGDDWLRDQDSVTAERAAAYLFKSFLSAARLSSDAFDAGRIQLEVAASEQNLLFTRVLRETGVQGVHVVARDKTKTALPGTIFFELINSDLVETIRPNTGNLYLSYNPRTNPGQIALFDAPTVFAWALLLSRDASQSIGGLSDAQWTGGEWVSPSASAFADNHILSNPLNSGSRLAQLVTGSDTRLLADNLLKIVRLNLRELLKTTMMRLRLTSISA